MYRKINSILLFVFAVLFIASCQKVKVKSVEKELTSGTWRITLFSEDNDDQTSHFSSYTFTFKDGGTVIATNSNNTISGTWTVTKDNSNDDSSSDVDFILSFPATDDFDELNDDWDILTQTSSKLELKDVSGGNGGTDLLTFEKN